MTQEEKQLLLTDLSVRLPYKVKLNCCGDIGEKLISINSDGLINSDYDIEEVKPYLLPLSSMTEEQKYTCPIGVGELETFIKKDNWSVLTISPNEIIHFVNWLNKNHFDYRGLIEKSLALDATGKNIY